MFRSHQAVNPVQLVQLFVDKSVSLYEGGIMKVTERWQQIIEHNGQYIIE